MPAPARSTARTLLVAVRALLVLTLLFGVAYPLAIGAIGQLALPAQAHGSIVRDADGRPVGSALLGQSTLDADGEPIPTLFQSRPSAAGDGYDGTASSGSNLGPEHPDFIAAIEERRLAVAELEGVPVEAVPADAVTASASGLDPHISPEYARLQVERVAAARGLEAESVRALVEALVQQPDLGFLGGPTVNVLRLNLALEELED